MKDLPHDIEMLLNRYSDAIAIAARKPDGPFREAHPAREALIAGLIAWRDGKVGALPPETNAQLPRRLKLVDAPSAGFQIHADLPFKANCAEFTLKATWQPLAHDTWIQFKPADYENMERAVFSQMVRLWNANYATVPPDPEDAFVWETREYFDVTRDALEQVAKRNWDAGYAAGKRQTEGDVA